MTDPIPLDFMPSGYFDPQEPLELVPVASPGSGVVWCPYSPAFEVRWDQMTKLRWMAGTILCDTGLRVVVARAKSFTNGLLDRGQYAVSVGNGVRMAMNFKQASAYLDGVKRGAETAQRKNADS